MKFGMKWIKNLHKLNSNITLRICNIGLMRNIRDYQIITYKQDLQSDIPLHITCRVLVFVISFYFSIQYELNKRLSIYCNHSHLVTELAVSKKKLNIVLIDRIIPYIETSRRIILQRLFAWEQIVHNYGDWRQAFVEAKIIMEEKFHRSRGRDDWRQTIHWKGDVSYLIITCEACRQEMWAPPAGVVRKIGGARFRLLHRWCTRPSRFRPVTWYHPFVTCLHSSQRSTPQVVYAILHYQKNFLHMVAEFC